MPCSGVLWYCRKAFATASEFSEPPGEVLPKRILLADFTAASARPFDCGKCEDDTRRVTRQAVKNALASWLTRLVPPSHDSISGMPNLLNHLLNVGISLVLDNPPGKCSTSSQPLSLSA